MKKLGLIIALILLPCTAFCGTISFDQIATSADLTVAKWNSDIDRLYIKINSALATDNITAATLTEPDFADEINPRVRDYEIFGEFVDTGLLQTTTSGTLLGTIPAGTAYPRGYRVNKASGTAKTYTASKWTFADIDINGNFQYSEVAVGAATPTIATNSIRLFRASTDGTQVVAVQDLRILNPTAPFRNQVDGSGESTMEDILNTGSPIFGGRSVGWIQGCQISYDTATTFIVRRGSIWINGHFRNISTDITVPVTNDDPTNGTSGLDTGAIANTTSYDIYAVADQDSVKPFSVSFSTSTSAPAATTNYRKIGHTRTNSAAKFVSSDIISQHSLMPQQIIAAWADLDATGNIKNSSNVAAVIIGSAGIRTLVWDFNFNNINYACSGITTEYNTMAYSGATLKLLGSSVFLTFNTSGVASSVACSMIAIGDKAP